MTSKTGNEVLRLEYRVYAVLNRLKAVLRTMGKRWGKPQPIRYRTWPSKLIRHPDGRTTTLPHHQGRLLARPLLREILREIEITVEQYNNLLKP